jgi:hypothetical protein
MGTNKLLAYKVMVRKPQKKRLSDRIIILKCVFKNRLCSSGLNSAVLLGFEDGDGPSRSLKPGNSLTRKILRRDPVFQIIAQCKNVHCH